MGRGRQPGFSMSNEHRVKIQNSNILNALIEHAEGQREMSATQVSAALGLLKKALPDLNAVAMADASSEQGKQILAWEGDEDNDSLQAAEPVPALPRED
jgi:hypothetical protein